MVEEIMLPNTWNELWSSWYANKSAMNCYDFQREQVGRCARPVLNAACAYDPADLGDMGAINMDIQQVEPWTNRDFSKCKQYINGDVRNIPFPNRHFGAVVLGEFLEHCTVESAAAALSECHRALRDEGVVIITLPLDARPRGEQEMFHTAGMPIPPDMYCDDITAYHSMYWSNTMLDTLFIRTGFIEILRQPLLYFLTAPVGGWGLVLRKSI